MKKLLIALILLSGCDEHKEISKPRQDAPCTSKLAYDTQRCRRDEYGTNCRMVAWGNFQNCMAVTNKAHVGPPPAEVYVEAE